MRKCDEPSVMRYLLLQKWSERRRCASTWDPLASDITSLTCQEADFDCAIQKETDDSTAKGYQFSICTKNNAIKTLAHSSLTHSLICNSKNARQMQQYPCILPPSMCSWNRNFVDHASLAHKDHMKTTLARKQMLSALNNPFSRIITCSQTCSTFAASRQSAVVLVAFQVLCSG